MSNDHDTRVCHSILIADACYAERLNVWQLILRGRTCGVTDLIFFSRESVLTVEREVEKRDETTTIRVQQSLRG